MKRFLVLVDLDPANSDAALANQDLIQMGLLRYFTDERGRVRPIPSGGYGAQGTGSAAGLRNHILGRFYNRHWVSNILVVEIAQPSTGQHGEEPGARPARVLEEVTLFVDAEGESTSMSWEEA